MTTVFPFDDRTVVDWLDIDPAAGTVLPGPVRWPNHLMYAASALVNEAARLGGFPATWEYRHHLDGPEDGPPQANVPARPEVS